jgi:dephospho-CoA kinase
MFIVGLTGGIGSGKSTATSLFAAKGVPTLNADTFSHQLVQPGQPALAAIVSHFGSDMLTTDGYLNRPKLREHIFKHAEDKLWLEQLLHPLILAEISRAISLIKAPYCVVEIPLLVETGHYPWLSRICVVDCPESLQLTRTQARTHLPLGEIEAIMKTQASRQERLNQADDVIDNSGTVAQLQAKIDALHEYYLSLC